MTRADPIPSAVRRALGGDEDVVAFVVAGRVGAHARSQTRGRTSALSLWVAAMSRGAAEKKAEGLAVPSRCWLALTDRCVVVVSCDTRERQLDRRVSLRRVTRVDTARREDVPVLRVSLLDGERLFVEVPSAAEGTDLARFATLLRTAAGAGGPAVAQHSTMFTATGTA